MSKIKAADGAQISINGIPFPIPKGTTIGIRKGNDDNLVVTGTEQNGDGTNTSIFSVVSGMLEGVVLSITDAAKEDLFHNFFAEDEHQVVLSNAGTSYSMETAILISPSEEGPPSVESNTRKTEAFNIKSQQGKIRRS